MLRTSEQERGTLSTSGEGRAECFKREAVGEASDSITASDMRKSRPELLTEGGFEPLSSSAGRDHF